MALEGEIGWIGKNCPMHHKVKLVTWPGVSAAGWFIATFCPDCRREGLGIYHSRETEYYPDRKTLVDTWNNDRVNIRWRTTLYNTDAIKAELMRPIDFGEDA